MSDYISREHLMLELHSGNIDLGFVYKETYRKLREFSEEVDKIIRNLPAADVQPVRHGRWVEVKGFTGVEAFGYREECVDGLACSVCGKEVDVSEGYFRYCPNCGAKMEVSD